MTFETRCQNCGRNVTMDTKDLDDVPNVTLYFTPPSIVCGDRCEMHVERARALIGSGWALTPGPLRQEARA